MRVAEAIQEVLPSIPLSHWVSGVPWTASVLPADGEGPNPPAGLYYCRKRAFRKLTFSALDWERGGRLNSGL